MTSEKKWRIVYTRPGCELKVAELLSKRNIENYCPLHKGVQQLATRKRTDLQPVFDCCVFVRIQDMEQNTIKKMKGIVNFLFWLDQPALIRDEEVQSIRFFLTEHTSIELEKIKLPAAEAMAAIEENGTDAFGDMKVYLPSLHYALVAKASTVAPALLPIPVYEPAAQFGSSLYSLQPEVV